MRTLLATAIVLVLTTGTASAAEVSLQPGKTLVYTAAAGEINDVAINLQGSEYTIQDTAGSPLSPQAPCTKWTDPMLLGTGAKCPATDVKGIQVTLGDQTDEASVGGISNLLIPVNIDAGPGPDRIFSGGGPDTINVYNGVAGDNVTCNDGEDTVYADPGDTVAPSCEHVVRQSPSAPFVGRVRVGASTVRYGCSTSCIVTGKLFLRGRQVGTVGPADLPKGGAVRLKFPVRTKRTGRLRLSTTFVTPTGAMQLDNTVAL
jgi:hypothetical protein